jgi:hypothetical protein
MSQYFTLENSAPAEFQRIHHSISISSRKVHNRGHISVQRFEILLKKFQSRQSLSRVALGGGVREVQARGRRVIVILGARTYNVRVIDWCRNAHAARGSSIDVTQ